ncbi:hypothetical protein [Undibacterium sp. Ji49W]|uniref:hypothetical protein n=1 Tax=Undibacterium sp. Ji49W TaxID=3413040 RepID=UPI003BF2D9CA
MHIVVRPAKGFLYSTKVHEFPVDIEIMTDVPVEITGPVDVTYAMLTKVEDEDLSFGYGQRITPGKRPSIILTPSMPLLIQINVFEHDNDFSDFVPSEYRCEINVLVEVRNETKNQMLDLRGSFVIDIP